MKYRVIKMKDVSNDHRMEISNWIEQAPLSGETRKIAVYCGVCKVEIIPSMDRLYWEHHWTPREQAHEASEEHRVGLLLQKLAGED